MAAIAGAGTRRHVPALDGLRGLAVVAVLAYHLDVVGAGFLGVDLFFVLSGFLITRVLLNSAEVWYSGSAANPLRSFWPRRFRRLLPAALVTLLGVAVLGVIGVFSSPTLRYEIGAALASMANWRLILSGDDYANLFREPSPIRHFWSLAVEEQFYLVWPFVLIGSLALARRRGWKPTILPTVLAVVGAAVSATLMWRFFDPGAPSRAYYGTDTRVFGPLVGAAIALVTVRAARQRTGEESGPSDLVVAAGTDHRDNAGLFGGPEPQPDPSRRPAAGSRPRRQSAWAMMAGLAIVVAGAVLVRDWGVNTPRYYQGGALLFAGGCGLVVWLADRTTTGPFTWTPLRWAGLVSYGLYLYHWPVFLALTPARTGWSEPWLSIVRLAVTVGVAAVSYVFIEQPIRRGHQFRGRGLPVAGVAFAAVMVAVLLVPVPVQTTTLNAIDLKAPPPAIEAGADSASASTNVGEAVAASGGQSRPRADISTLGRPVRLMVIGDSVGFNIGGGLEAWSKGRTDLVVWNRSRIACGFEQEAQVVDGDSLFPKECHDWIASFPEWVATFNPDVVLVLIGDVDQARRTMPAWNGPKRLGDPEFDAQLHKTYGRILTTLASGGASIVLATFPCFDDVFLAGGKPRPDGRSYRATNDLFNETLRTMGPPVIDLNTRVCPGGTFTDTVEGLSRSRPDGLHFTDKASAALAPWVYQQILAVT